MAQQSKKKKTKKYDTEKILKTAAIILVILVLISIAAFQFGNVTYSSLGSSINNALNSSGKGSGYPYSVNASSVKSFKISSSDLVLLYDTGVKMLDPTAKEISDFQHNYSSPLLFTFVSRNLVIDGEGKKFKIQSKNKVLSETELSFDILTGDIAENGDVAIVSRSDSATSMLTVYNKDLKEKFKWLCAKEQIVTVDLSDDGNYIAVGVIGAEGGDIYSNVYLFDKDYAEPIESFNFPGTSVVSVEMLNGKNFLIIGDNMAAFVDKKATCNNIDVSLNTVSRYSTSESNVTALLLSKYGSAYSKILNIYNKNGKLLSTVEIDDSVKSISCDGKYVCVLTSGSLLTYNLQGEKIGEKSVNSDAERCCISGGSAYVLFSKQIEKYSSIGINTSDAETTN